MNVNELSGTKDASVKSTGILKSTSEIAKLVSNEYLKELELKEYCKIVESDFIKFQKKFQDLMNDKNQSASVKAEYKSRNKINIHNSESLLKALHELTKYKCELKLGYVTAEKEMKLKKLKYKKIITGYESAWNETLEKFNKTSVNAELLKIQEENHVLERELEKQEKLLAFTKSQFNQLKDDVKKNFNRTLVKFSEFMVKNINFLNSERPNEKKESFKARITGRALDFKFLRTKQPLLIEKNSLDNNSDVNIFNSIDLTIFDDIMVPSENLESQHLEEDSFSVLQNSLQQINDSSKDPAEGLDPQETQQKDKKSKDLREASGLEENESRYFRQQPIEYLKQLHAEKYKEAECRTEENFKLRNTKEKLNGNVEGTTEKTKAVNNAAGTVVPQTESEDEVVRDVQMECEESLSDGSYEKQYGIQRAEIYDCQKTSSVSSEDLPPSGDNPNENEGPIRQSCEDQQSKNLKPQNEIQTNELKTFTGFFTMGSENENPTPSIFKLF